MYVVEAEPYIRKWGIWPEHDMHKRQVSIADVTQIDESPRRLPAQLATKMYEAGETGMGYSTFTLVLCDGRQVPASAGNAVDFVELPQGVTGDMVVDLIPHEAGEQPPEEQPTGELAPGTANGDDFSWCLYRMENERS